MSSIHIPRPALEIRAGSVALAHIRERGLHPEDIAILPGAAGGPKALGIQGLDLALFGEWLPRAPRVRTLIGASIGSWRFASACLPDPVASLRRLGELYTGLRFERKASIAEVTRSCREMLEALLQDQDEAILGNAHYRLNVMVVRSQGLLTGERRLQMALGLSSVIASNLLGRRRLAAHFERIVMHDPRQTPPLGELNDFPSRCIPMDRLNLRAALLASGSIPLVMEGIRDIPGAGPGTYRDGGLLDYHLDLPYQEPGLVLYPHFTNRVIPGWFDKGMPWRKADSQRLAGVVLLSPSPEYLARLPHGKLPDRTDFKRYVGNDEGRARYWRQAMAESQRLGDEFLELVEKGALLERLKPL